MSVAFRPFAFRCMLLAQLASLDILARSDADPLFEVAVQVTLIIETSGDRDVRN